MNDVIIMRLQAATVKSPLAFRKEYNNRLYTRKTLLASGSCEAIRLLLERAF